MGVSDTSEGAQTPSVALGPDRLGRMRAELKGLRDAVRDSSRRLAPNRGFEVVLQFTEGVDRLVRALAVFAEAEVEQAGGPAARALAERVEILALGSYGRRELCPWSDIDLLFLLPSDVPKGPDLPVPVRQFVEGVLYGLWDLGFEVGQAVRNVEQTLETAHNDASVLTALLDARLIARGGVTDAICPSLDALQRALEAQLLSGPRVAALIEAKLKEADSRHDRFGDSVFLLEPNVKESEGGLRELHTARWVARARWRARDLRHLVRLGVLSSREGQALERAYGFLLRVRTELHFIARRRQDHLRFEYQEQIAPVLGYVDADEKDPDRRTHGVERFMRAYYFNAGQLRLHSGMIVERGTSHHRRQPCQAIPAPGGFKLWDGRLTVSDRSQFTKDPVALIRIFRVAQEESLEIYSYTKNLIAEHVGLIDRELRRSPLVLTEFLALLEDPKADGAIMEVMHDLGVLRRLIPEISRVTARWQHSLYHVYTVDVHSLVVLKNLKRLRNGAFIEVEREMTRLCAGLPRPGVLYLAGLLHDVGKGWPRGDHSKRGERVARVIGERFEQCKISGWTSTETEDLAWLVRQHLTMSNISQRRDLSDRLLLESFAEEVRTQERLVMLYLLTFADMKGTSPKVWTDWKRGLLKELFHATRGILEHQAQGHAQVELHFALRRQRSELELLQEAQQRGDFNLEPDVVRTFIRAVPTRYMLSFNARRMVRHAQMWRDVSRRGGLAMHVRHLRREGRTKLTVAAPDQPGLLALIAGTLAAHSLQILTAQVFSTQALAPAVRVDPATPPEDEAEAYAHVDSSPGAPAAGQIALDVLYVTDAHGELCDDPQRWTAVRADLRDVVRGGKNVETLLSRRRPSSRLELRHRPAVKNRVELAREDSNRETVIDVFCEDRMGTLYTIAKTLMEQGLSISLAKISTQGHRVADGFYVTDAKTGLKIESQERLQEILKALEAALEAMTAQASSPPDAG